MRSTILLFVFSLLISSASFASTNCVWKRDIRDWFALDNNTVQIWAITGTYDFTVRNCSGLAWAERIGFRTFPRSSFEVCEGDDLLVFDRFGRTVINRCRILDITR